MIKAKRGNDLILGLSDTNLQRLQKGEPIKFNLSELGMGDGDVIIFHGKDEQIMKTMMRDSIHPHKTILKDSRADQN